MSKRIIYFLVTVFVFLFAKTNALTYFSKLAGNWSVQGNWSKVGFGGVPAASFPGQLEAGEVVLINDYPATVNVMPFHQFSFKYKSKKIQIT